MSVEKRKKHETHKTLPLDQYTGFPRMRTGLDMLKGALASKGSESDHDRNTFINTFILHDVRAAISSLNFLRPVLDHIERSDPDHTQFSPEVWNEIEAYYDASRKGNKHVLAAHEPRDALLASGAWINAYNRLSVFLPDLDGKYADDQFVRSATTLARTWNIFHHSSLFLLGITSHNERQAARSFQKLVSSHYRTQDIIDVSIVKNVHALSVSPQLPQQLSGIEALILHNFLKNADRHAIKTIDIFCNDGSVVVQNDSYTYPDQSTLFLPGEPGAGGNTGFGLFTMKHIFGALGGYDVDLISEEHKEHGALQTVAFAMKAQRPVSSLSQSQ